MLTNCQTGDRIVICGGPVLRSDIPRTIPIGKYRATIIYKGQPNPNFQPKCSKCFQIGHRANECQNEWKCKSCGQSGHKQNECTNGVFSEEDQDNESHHDDSFDEDANQPPITNNAAGDMNSDSHLQMDNDDHQSQSLLAGTPQVPETSMVTEGETSMGARPKAIPRRNGPNPASSKTTKQKKITGFATGKDKDKFKTPHKSQNNSQVTKSPVTPTEILHDNEKGGKKKSKPNT